MKASNGSTSTRSENTTRKIYDLLNEIEICLIWRRGGESDLRRRPMTIEKNSLGGGLWFFSPTGPYLDRLYGTNPQVTVAISNPITSKCAALTGSASIVDNPECLARLTAGPNKAMLPSRNGSEKLVLLKIEIEHMDFWEWPSGTLIHSSVDLQSVVSGFDQRRTSDGQRSFAFH